MTMVQSLLLGIWPEETWMKPIKGISREGNGGISSEGWNISPGGG